MIKSITNNFLKKKSAPIICFFGSMLVFAIILLGYSSSYAAIVDYGQIKTKNYAASNGYSISLTYPESTTFNINNAEHNPWIKTQSQIKVTTNSVSGHKLYISSSEKSLKTSDGTAEIPYDNLTANLVQKTDISPDTWALLLKKGGVDYVLPMCANDNLTDNCKISESNAPVTLEESNLMYGLYVTLATKPGTYSSKPLVLTAVINSGPTAELKINSVSPSAVPLDPTGHTVKNEAGQSLKHKMNIKIPMIERDFNVESYDYRKFKATAGGLDCPIDPTTFQKTTDEISFDCTVDFNNANPLFQVGQKTEVVVETIPYGYIYSKQDAIQFANSWADFGYTGTPQAFTFPITGKYKLEVMGASGGPRTASQQAFQWYYNKDFNPGLGGYSSGYKDFNAGDSVALFVGGRGESAIDAGHYSKLINYGGFNGGGNGAAGPLSYGNPDINWRNWGGAGGGGGTDIRPVSNIDYVTDTNFHIELRPAGSTEQLLNKGPWAPLDHGVYQAVFEVEGIPDSDFEGAVAYYDLNSSVDKQFLGVYPQKHGNFISVYFTYDPRQPAPQYMPNTAAEIRLKVKTTNTTARIKSMKIYELRNRIIVGGGGAGGSLIAGGGHGGGLIGGKPDFSGVTSDPYYPTFSMPDGANQTAGAGYGFGASAPVPDINLRSPAINALQVQGRSGAGGGWIGGYTGQGPYDQTMVGGSGSGGSGYIGGVTSGFTRKFDDNTNISPYWQPNFVYDGHDGSIRISYATYPGGTP